LAESGRKLWVWGNNKHAQLSLGDTENRFKPQEIIPEETQTHQLVEGEILSVVCGHSTTFFFTASQILGCGFNR
jgi:alpha-tubulin suppressor-like RCC1 family protein